MKSTFKIFFYIKADKQKANGKAPIYARITIEGQMIQFSVKLEISPKLWNAKLRRATGASVEAATTNELLDHIKAQILSKHQGMTKFGEFITPETLRDAYLGVDLKNNTLLQLFTDYNDRHEKLIGIDITQSTFNKYDLTLRRLEEFLRVKRRTKDIPLCQINPEFVMDFHTFLKIDHRMSINSSEKLVRIFKRITTYAFKSGMILRDPFALYTIRKERKDRGYLTEEELARIKNFKTDCLRLEKVRDIFIFACHTGFDFSTLASLTEDNLIRTNTGPFVIAERIKTIRTGVKSEVKLLPEALAILEKYKDKRVGNRLLPIMSNAKYNQYLKELAKAAGVEKRVTSHLARHTFATTITLANGVSLSAIQKMLGHTKIATTQIYARMLDSTVEREMDKLAEVMRAKQMNDVQRPRTGLTS